MCLFYVRCLLFVVCLFVAVCGLMFVACAVLVVRCSFEGCSFVVWCYTVCCFYVFDRVLVRICVCLLVLFVRCLLFVVCGVMCVGRWSLRVAVVCRS